MNVRVIRDDWNRGKAAELSFVEEGIRSLQRQREVFLGFAVTVVAAGALQVARTPIHNDRYPNLYLFPLAAMVAVAIASWLIWRNSREILRGAIYAAMVLEPDIPGRHYQSALHRLRVDHLDGQNRWWMRWRASPANGASVGYAASLIALGVVDAYLWWVTRHGATVVATALTLLAALGVTSICLALRRIGSKSQVESIIKQTAKMRAPSYSAAFTTPDSGDEVNG